MSIVAIKIQEFMRLDKYISNQTPLSRSEAVKAIRNGKVTVDDHCIRDPKTHVNENNSSVELEGQSVSYRKNIYLMLNKPVDYISSTDDPRHQTVLDLLPEEYACRNPFPCGRLDIDTTGLVLLTDDGPWGHNITSPKKKCFKTYIVATLRNLSEDEALKIKEGVFLDGDERITKPAKLKKLDDCKYELQISEGRFHQVKRMMESIGNKVMKLHRQAIGPIALDSDLKLGEYRELTEEEISIFRK